MDQIRKYLGPDWTPLRIAKDGCGLPTVSNTVSELAQIYAGLVRDKDDDWIWEAMVRHPDLVGGFNRLDSTVLKAGEGRVIAKEGADGLLGLAIEHPDYPKGLGIVVKIAHGWNSQATWYVARALLGVLGIDLRNPYPLHRQKAFIVPGIVPNETLETVNPATGDIITTLPRSGPNDVEAATSAALRASSEWAATPIAERIQWLERLADALEEEHETIARLESMDTGKPISLARRVDASRSVTNFRFFAEFGGQHEEPTFSDHGAVNHIHRSPIGCVGLITPWNLPLYLLTWKVAPALLMGNTIVAKPSELTPLTAHHLASVIQRIGLPKGVFNLVHGLGPEVGQAIVEHPQIRGISFTGGTSTGKIVAATAAPMFKKISLELGGKNATVALDDAPLDESMDDFVRPTVFEGLSHTSRTATEEIFGPVVTLHSFDNEDEAVAMANATEYGLAGSVWTNDVQRGHAFGQRLDTGIVWVNTWLNRDLRTPFGGVKQSGVGREGGAWSLNFFSELTNICVLQP